MENIINDIERLNMIECIKKFNFAKGSEVYFLHKFINLGSNQYRSRRDFEYQIVDDLRICSKSTFDKTFSLLNKIRPKLMTRSLESQLEILTKDSYDLEKNDGETCF